MSRDGIAAAATAVVVVVLGAAFVLTRADLDPEGSGDPTTSARTAPDACGAGDLVAGPARLRAAAGTAYLTASLTLAPGVEPCTVEGFPEVLVLTGGLAAGVATTTDEALGRPQRIVVLPDRSAKLTLGWPVGHYCGPVDNDIVRIRVAPGLLVEFPGFGPTSCAPGEGRPPVRVGAFAYVDPRAQRGTVAGVVTLNGGPALGTGEFVTSGEVVFAGDVDTHRAPIGQDGSYEIRLPAGSYDVRVTTHQWHAGAPYSAGSFDVTGGELAGLNLILPVR